MREWYWRKVAFLYACLSDPDEHDDPLWVESYWRIRNKGIATSGT